MRKGNFLLMQSFPDFNTSSFDIEDYNKRFYEYNVIINALAKQVHYPEHWGCFSLKAVFKGEEYYQLNKISYKVSPQNFLLLNEGSFYSSFIDTKETTESFTLNFTREFLTNALKSITEKENLDQYNGYNENYVVEKLYHIHTPLKRHLLQLKDLIADFNQNHLAIEEIYYRIIEEILLTQRSVAKEAASIRKQKSSTQKELYKRLHLAKDYIESCYSEEISIADLAQVTCMNSSYFLREFKSYFKVTPRQYLIKKRLEKAASLLREGSMSVTEVCNLIGYSDVSSFGKRFKQVYQTAPENFKKSISA